MDTNHFINSIFGLHPQKTVIDEDTIKYTNDTFDMYLRKNTILFVVDKRDQGKKRIYANFRTAKHYLLHERVSML